MDEFRDGLYRQFLHGEVAFACYSKRMPSLGHTAHRLTHGFTGGTMNKQRISVLIEGNPGHSLAGGRNKQPISGRMSKGEFAAGLRDRSHFEQLGNEIIELPVSGENDGGIRRSSGHETKNE